MKKIWKLEFWKFLNEDFSATGILITSMTEERVFFAFDLTSIALKFIELDENPENCRWLIALWPGCTSTDQKILIQEKISF